VTLPGSPAGQIQLKRWFPGFVEEAIAAGAVVPPFGTFDFFMNGRRRTAPPGQTDQPGLVSTRPFLESLVRRRTLAIDNIRALNGRAVGLLLDGQRVVGVRYAVGDDALAAPNEEHADLVVDAMGRSSRLTDWLADHGFPRPPVQRMGIKLNYATALYRRHAVMSDIWITISYADSSGGRLPSIGGVQPVEDDRWMVLVSGYADDRPSRDTDDFIRRCTNLPPWSGRVGRRGAKHVACTSMSRLVRRQQGWHRWAHDRRGASSTRREPALRGGRWSRWSGVAIWCINPMAT
jgi:hypothetical protein